MPNSTKIWRTQPPDCHIHVSLLVWIPGPLLSQLSGQKVPAPHGTSSFAPEWRSEENYNKSCAHFLLMPSRPSVPPSQPPVKHQRRVIQASCGISGSWDGAVGRESKTPSVTVTVRTSLGGRDLLGHPSTWDLRIVKKTKLSLPLPLSYNQLSKAHGPTAWKYICPLYLIFRVSITQRTQVVTTGPDYELKKPYYRKSKFRNRGFFPFGPKA